jgi:hypothetical protein
VCKKQEGVSWYATKQYQILDKGAYTHAEVSTGNRTVSTFREQFAGQFLGRPEWAHARGMEEVLGSVPSLKHSQSPMGDSAPMVHMVDTKQFLHRGIFAVHIIVSKVDCRILTGESGSTTVLGRRTSQIESPEAETAAGIYDRKPLEGLSSFTGH